MSTVKRAAVVAAAVATLLGAAATPAGAWPIALTTDDINYLNATRGVFPGDDDQLLLVGRQMCRLLYTGQSSAAVIDTMSVQYGASPEQTSTALSAARSTLCTQAPG